MKSELETRKGKPSLRVIDLPEKIPLALSELLQDHSYALDLSQNVWEFATEIRRLQDFGITSNDLRWMIGRGWMQHAIEHCPPKDDCRSFHKHGCIEFCMDSCFVLTPEGVTAAREARNTECRLVAAIGQENPVSAPEEGAKPHWDSARNRLYFGRILVKAFRVPSPNQTTVLSAFEEEHWPSRIDDPLPYSRDVSRKERLRYTLKSLNKHQKVPMLHFSGDGSGDGVLWETVQSSSG